MHWNNYWHTYTSINLVQNGIITLLNGLLIMPCERQHTNTRHNQRQLRHVSLNVISIVKRRLVDWIGLIELFLFLLAATTEALRTNID